MKKGSFSVSIPFPAWDGVYKVEEFLGSLRGRSTALASIPGAQTPRRISMKTLSGPRLGAFPESVSRYIVRFQEWGSCSESHAFDEVKLVEYWYGGGFYISALLSGRDDSHYGWQWELTWIRVRWKFEGTQYEFFIPTDWIKGGGPLVPIERR